MRSVDKMRRLLSDGGYARVITWIWVLSWAEHAISSREEALSQLLVAVGGVAFLTWEGLQARTGPWAGLSIGLHWTGAIVLATAGVSRESGYLLAWGAVVIVVTYGMRSGPLVLVLGAALSVGALCQAAGAEPLSVLPGTLVQFFVLYLLQSLARTARELRRTEEELARSEVDAERDRLAVQISQLVGVTLSTVALQVGEARAYFADDEKVLRHLVDVDDLVERGLRQLDQLSYEPVVDDLDAELHTAHTLCRRLGVELVESVDAVPESVGTTFALALRESVTNMFKHADPTRCTVVVRDLEGEALFSLTNDGVRSGSTTSSGLGTGQNRLRSEIDSVGGSVDAGQLAQGRYRVVVRVPTLVRAGEDLLKDPGRDAHG